MNLRRFFTTQLVATCALCHAQRAYEGATPAKLEKALLDVGWQAVEIETDERVYGGIVCEFCARFAENGQLILETKGAA